MIIILESVNVGNLSVMEVAPSVERNSVVETSDLETSALETSATETSDMEISLMECSDGDTTM